ncbi:MAG: MauE/DoxX family redox-associated membrane protein [Acidobacteriota bacterium]|nr:MauE/DoxX family redox-associated membrane protein [Acidobacteriota bacterium]
MFDTSSFRIRYKAPVEKQALLYAGPGLVVFFFLLSAISRFLFPFSLPGMSASFLSLLFPIFLVALVALGVEVVFGADEGYPWRRSGAAAGAGVISGTFLVAAWGKILDPESSQQTIMQEGLAGILPASIVALAAIGLEVFLGVVLLAGVRRVWTLVMTGLLVGLFLFLNGRAYMRFVQGVELEDAACGCFGSLLERTPAEAFWQDFALLVPPLVLASLAVAWRARVGRQVALAGGLSAAAVVVAFLAPDLALDDLATRLRPGTEVAGVCTGTGDERLCLPTLVPELAEGEHLVVLADLEDEEFGKSVDGLNRYWQGAEGPRLWVLSAVTPEQSQAFFWQHGPSFETREAPPGLLRPLYRKLPRSFLVADGTVRETYRGLPPSIEGGA